MRSESAADVQAEEVEQAIEEPSPEMAAAKRAVDLIGQARSRAARDSVRKAMADYLEALYVEAAERKAIAEQAAMLEAIIEEEEELLLEGVL